MIKTYDINQKMHKITQCNYMVRNSDMTATEISKVSKTTLV